MRALTVIRPSESALLERHDPIAGPGEVLIRPVIVGLCGTDLEIIDGRIDPAFVSYPIVLGHEWSGVVVGSGPGVDLLPGTRVVVEGIVPCNRCRECATGDTNRCENYDEFGFVRDGAAADLLVAPAALVHVLAARVTFAAAALVEPAAVALRALERVGSAPGARVLVIGDGTVGLLTARLVRLWNPGEVVISGIRDAQAQLAAGTGADVFTTADPGDGFDLVVEAAGAAAGAELALRAVRRGGTVVLLGFPGPGVALPAAVDDLVNADVAIVGSFNYTSATWRRTVDALNHDRLGLDFLVTHTFDLADWQAAVATLRAGDGPRGKVQLRIGPD